MKKNNSFLPLILTVFIDLLGVGIVIPILAPLFLDFRHGILPVSYSFSTRTIILGFLIASYSIAQFFGAPMLGAASDHIGRKKMLLLSLAGTLVGYLLFAIGITTNQLWLLFVGRIIDGFTGGNISIAQSAIADLSDEKTKVRNFGLIGMAFGVGFVIGPYIGGKLADPGIVSWFNYATPFLFTAILTFINIIWVFIRFRETLRTKVYTKISPWTGIRNFYKAMTLKDLRIIFIVVLLITFGFNFFSQLFQVFLIEKFQFTQSRIGDLFAYMGIWIAVAQGGIARPLSKKLSSRQILTFSIGLLASTLPILLIVPKSQFIYLVIPFIAIFQGLTQPNTIATVSRLSSQESQGEILGINQSIQSIGQAIPPIISGFIISIDRNLPILVAGGSIFVAWLIYILFFREESTEKFVEV